MAAIEMIVKVVLALGVVLFVGYPLVKNRWDDDDAYQLPEEVEELYRRKESAYSALKELEFDFKTGKLSEADFHELDAKYRAEAVEILEAIEALEAPEAPTGSERRRGGGRRRATPERERAGGRAGAPAPLSEPGACACGYVNVEGARFCASCGASLEHAPSAETDSAPGEHDEWVCAACGAELRPGHRFCGSCGVEVHA